MQKPIVIVIITIKIIRDIFKICFVIFLLWVCGYISLNQLVLFYIILIGGIILSAIAPAISSIYSIPSEWIGLKPAMILFNKFTHEHLQEINCLEEDELEKAIQTYNEAAKIISMYLSDSPDLLSKYPEISEAFLEVNIGMKKAQRLHSLKKTTTRNTRGKVETTKASRRRTKNTGRKNLLAVR